MICSNNHLRNLIRKIILYISMISVEIGRKFQIQIIYDILVQISMHNLINYLRETKKDNMKNAWITCITCVRKKVLQVTLVCSKVND